MENRKTGIRFETTSWTLVDGARDNRADLERLLGQYWSPVYAFLRRSGQSVADAEDLTQAFLSKVVLERHLIDQADRNRGRFRSFIMSSLSRFVIDEYRHRRGRDGRRAQTFVPDDPNALAAAEPSEADEPAGAFHRQWATAVLDRALTSVEASCRREGLERPWTAFEARVLRPAQQNCDPIPIEELIEQLGAAGPQEIYSMLQTVKRKLQRELKAVVGETVDDPAEVDAEIDELREFLKLA
jgi:RNA polymerase sigma-70 factor (ECF subfamily)